jgi:multiple sugar transport system substrate-binding protein
MTIESGRGGGRARAVKAAFLAAAVLAATAAAWAILLRPKSGEPITLSFAVYSGNNWGVPDGRAYAIYDRAKEMFEARPENAGIRIKLVTGTLYRDYSEWFAQSVMKGREPDLFMVKEDDFNIFASVGIMEDLRPYLRKDRFFRAAAFYPKALEAGALAGAQYSLPISVVPSFLIVNKTLLAREGLRIDLEDWTWGQFYRICRALTKDTDGDGVVDQFGVYGYTWQNAFYTNDQTLFSPDGSRTAFDNEALEETIEYMKRIYDLDRGVVAKESDFDRGHAGFRTFNLSEYRTYGTYPYRILKYSNFEWEVVPFPSGPRGHSMSKLYTVQVGMSSRSRHKEEAYRFLSFVAGSEDFQRRIWRESNVLPVNRNVIAELKYEGGNSENDERLLSFLADNRIMENLYVDPAFKWYSDMKTRIDDQVFKMIATDQNIRSGIPALRKDIDSLLAEKQE